MKVLEFLELQIIEYRRQLEYLREEGYSAAERERVERKIWHCEELIDKYKDMGV